MFLLIASVGFVLLSNGRERKIICTPREKPFLTLVGFPLWSIFFTVGLERFTVHFGGYFGNKYFGEQVAIEVLIDINVYWCLGIIRMAIRWREPSNGHHVAATRLLPIEVKHNTHIYPWRYTGRYRRRLIYRNI